MAGSGAGGAGTVAIGDLVVRRLGFGAMRLTGRGVWGHPPDRGTAKAVLRRAVELGVELIDTADSYGPSVSEELIAESLHPYPPGLVVATKGGLVRPGPGRWDVDGRPEHLRAACEGSLRRLRLEQLPLYQLHRPDPAVPLADSLGALVALRDEGKIRHIGLSNVDEGQAQAARVLTPIASIQNRYNLLDRSSDPVLAWCERTGTAFLPWAPVAGLDHHRHARQVAARHGVSPSRVALAWLLARSPVMAPIPGTGSIAHLEDDVAAGELALAPDDVAALTRLRPPA